MPGWPLIGRITLLLRKGMDWWQVTDDDIEDFRLVWTGFDPSAKGYIRLDKLVNLLKAVSPPLGLQGLPVTQNIMLNFQRKLPLKARALPADSAAILGWCLQNLC